MVIHINRLLDWEDGLLFSPKTPDHEGNLDVKTSEEWQG